MHQTTLKVTRVPTYQNRLICQIYNSTDRILSLDPETLTLKTFPWPVVGENRVSPDAMRDHRNSHHFVGPCCLCPLMKPLNKPRYSEAAIYMPVVGRYKGEYIAECARVRCGYLIPLERNYYRKYGVPVQRYRPRDVNAPRPPPCLHYSEDSEEPLPRPLKKRSLAETGLELDYETDWRKIVKLDCMDRPGLRRKEFLGLFTECEVCEYVVARQVFSLHRCRPLGEDGYEVELTDEATDQE